MYRPIHEHSAAIVLQDAAPAFIISGTDPSVFKSPAGVTFTVSGPTGIIEIPVKEIVTIGGTNKVTTLSQ